MLLSNRIDFLSLISISGANPNGDPAKCGMPRVDSRGFGVISPVCIRRKLRDRLAEMGEEILVSPPVAPGDALSRRAAGVDCRSGACAKWFDVRAFGQVFAFPGVHFPGIKGAVTIQPVYSADPVSIADMRITRCIRNNDTGRGSVMGSLHFVEYGLYVLKGSVNAYSAMKNGFTEEDALKLREALLHIFDNDSSAARPAGSMEVERLYWWRHSSTMGEYSPGRVFGTVRCVAECDKPSGFGDYRIVHAPLAGLEPEIFGEQ